MQPIKDKTNADTFIGNGHNNNNFLSKLISTVQTFSVVWDITTRCYLDKHMSRSRAGNKMLQGCKFC